MRRSIPLASTRILGTAKGPFRGSTQPLELAAGERDGAVTPKAVDDAPGGPVLPVSARALGFHVT
jgi:hypothetical protein